VRTAALLKGGTVVIPTVERAAGMRQRMRGLLGRRCLGAGRAMHLCPCRAVHTFFMAFPLDLVFLTRDLRVSRIVRNVRPGRVAAGGRGARSVLEMESGWLPPDALREGDRVGFAES
jgi:uncharacterized membrane protein (UPF0127 family)